MIEFLKVAGSVMAFVSTMLVLAGLFIPSLRRRKEFHFICGESSFITAIAYGCLAVLGAGSFAPWGFGLWFVTGSVKFAHVTFVAVE